MITVERKQIQVNGQPRLLIGGEIHYYRLPRDAWEDRVLKLKAAGGTNVASYIPWLCHELPDGTIDLDGRTRPELDLGAFIDLCHRHGMFFIARPGPFIMAEMKNEGIPYRIYTDFPEAVPVGWDGEPAPTKTLDYLAPRFLEAVDGWYAAVMRDLAPRLIGNGGPIIAVQLDNEVGMLSWVSNSPVLTDLAIFELRDWLRERYDAALRDRYPFADGEDDAWRQGVRSPEEGWALTLMQDLGHFRRDRYARYFAALRSMAERYGVRDVPFLINVHGTENGGGASYPIGISQLYPSWRQAPGYLPGSDHYLGNLTVGNAPDWYLMNAFTEAVSLPDQPLTSLEFEAGEGDYGGSAGTRLDPSTADFKLRMAVAQGNRLINYYLFTGGYNWRLPVLPGDGNDRISFTGERHGTGAPVNPEGELSYTLPRLARAHRAIAALEPTLATATEERDGIAVGFIPDAFMTESVHPGSERMSDLRDALVATRFGGPNGAMIRGLMQVHARYTAVDLQDERAEQPPALAIASSRAMDGGVQERLAMWLAGGGRLLLVGEVPETDLEGNACTVLANALGVRPVSRQEGGWKHYLSVEFSGWAGDRAEVRADWTQGLDAGENEVFASVYGTGEAVGVSCEVGTGRAIVLSAALPPDRSVYRELLARLGVTPGLAIQPDEPGVFVASARSEATGGRVIHLLNFDGYDKRLVVTEGGEPLFGGHPVTLRGRDGVMLPLGVTAGGCEVAWATVEIADATDDTVTFRLTGDEDVIAFGHPIEVLEGQAAATSGADGVELRTRRTSPSDERLTVRWA